MKFLHVFPSFEPGGAQLRVVAIMNSLPRSISHAVLALDGNFGAASRLEPGVSAELVAPEPRNGRGRFALALLRRMRRLNPSLTLTYNWGSIFAVMMAIAGRVAPVVHNECGLDIDESERLRPHRVWTRRFLLRETSRIIVTSSSMHRLALETFLAPREQVRCISTGVDTERFRPRRHDPWRTAHGIPPEAAVFGFMGVIRPVKNIELMLDAFAAARMPDAWLALFGDGPTRPALERRARELGVAGRVIFAGYAADPAEYYGAMDVFLLSSVTEQTSNALLEAMASGLPAVATAVGDNASLLAAAPPWALVPSGDRDAFAAAMSRLAADEGLRRRFGESNRRRCLEHHSQAAMIDSYGRVYREALGLADWPDR